MAFIVIALIDYLFTIKYALLYIQHILYCVFNHMLYCFIKITYYFIFLYHIYTYYNYQNIYLVLHIL